MRITSIALAAVLTAAVSVGGCTRGVDEEAADPAASGANSQESTPAPEPQQTQNEQPESSGPSDGADESQGPETTSKPPMSTDSQFTQALKPTTQFSKSPIFSIPASKATITFKEREVWDCHGGARTVEYAVTRYYRGHCTSLKVLGNFADLIFETVGDLEVEGKFNKVVGDKADTLKVHGSGNDIVVREPIDSVVVYGDNNTFTSTQLPLKITDYGDGNTFDAKNDI